MALSSSLSGTADECDLCKNAQSLDFCTVNLYKQKPLCETYPQQRAASESKQAHMHFMKEQLHTRIRTHTYSQRMKTLNPFSIILSALYFQALIFLFLWSRKEAVLSAVSTLCLNQLTPLQSCLDWNWWWWWKLHMFRDVLRVTETICSLLNNGQGHMLRQRSGY